MSTPALRFSVVIPAYNEAANLTRTLESIAAQSVAGGVEVIVVDNNSTDATADIAALAGATVLHEPRQGVCQARQLGTAAARGDIVVSTDADTVMPAGCLARMDAHFRGDPHCVAVAGPCRYVDGPWWAAAYSTLLFGSVRLIRWMVGHVWYATATNLAFRRDAWTGYDTRLTQGGDELDLLRRLRRRGRIVFDSGNEVATSARRLSRGLIYSLVVSLVFQYVLGYLLNRIVGRTLIPTAPAVRPKGSALHRPAGVYGVLGLTLVILVMLLNRDLTSDLLADWHRVARW